MTDIDRDDIVLDPEHARPLDAGDDLVAAVGRVSEAMEYVERARGGLYDFHQFTGHAHQLLEQAADELAAAGAVDSAEFLRREIVGRNVLPGRWTFQIVEEYDDHYYQAMRDAVRSIIDSQMQGRRHVYEAEMKRRSIDPDGCNQEATPREVLEQMFADGT